MQLCQMMIFFNYTYYLKLLRPTFLCNTPGSLTEAWSHLSSWPWHWGPPCLQWRLCAWLQSYFLLIANRASPDNLSESAVGICSTLADNWRLLSPDEKSASVLRALVDCFMPQLTILLMAMRLYLFAKSTCFERPDGLCLEIDPMFHLTYNANDDIVCTVIDSKPQDRKTVVNYQ